MKFYVLPWVGRWLYELEIGDAIFFHCNLLHSALSNRTQETKYSIVFTYYSNLNEPRKNTRSAILEDIKL